MMRYNYESLCSMGYFISLFQFTLFMAVSFIMWIMLCIVAHSSNTGRALCTCYILYIHFVSKGWAIWISNVLIYIYFLNYFSALETVNCFK